MTQITDRQLKTIVDTTNLKANIGKSRDEEGGVRVRSGSPGIAWLKSKFSKTVQKENVQARENFVARVTKDLGLDDKMAKRLHLEIVGTNAINGVKKMPLKVGQAQEAIKLMMELVDNLRNNVSYDPTARFFQEKFANKQNVPVKSEPKPIIEIKQQEEIGLDELLEDEPTTGTDRSDLSDPELLDVLGMLSENGTKKTEQNERKPSNLQSDLDLLDTLDEMLDDSDRKTDKPLGGGQKRGTIDENALFADIDGLVDEIEKKQNN